MKPTDIRIALLIDCDHVSSNAVEGVLAELAGLGRRPYQGDPGFYQRRAPLRSFRQREASLHHYF